MTKHKEALLILVNISTKQMQHQSNQLRHYGSLALHQKLSVCQVILCISHDNLMVL